MRSFAMSFVCVLGVGVLGACNAGLEGETPLLICHNSNCAGPTDPFRDDTMEALEESLALRHDGRPAFDGMEIDFIYWRAEDRCLFGHDLAHDAGGPDALVVAERIARHLRENEVPSWNGERFYVKIELKPEVGVDGERQDERDRERLSDCVLQVAAVIADAAREGDQRIVFLFTSEIGPPFATLARRKGWAELSMRRGVELRREAPLGVDLPPGMTLDVVDLEVGDVRDGFVSDFDDEGIDVNLAMYDATVETIDTMGRLSPRPVHPPLARRELGLALD
jgi:hypothetical protein